MDILENILSQGVVQKLGWTLLHSIWQGGVVALLLVILLRVLRKSSANLRYVIACLGLAVIVLLPAVTFYVVSAPAKIPDVESVPGFPAPVTEKPYKAYGTDMPLQRAAEYMQIFPTISLKQRAMNYYASALPYIVFSWFIGVLALCFWHLGGWVHLQRLKRQKVNLVDESLKDRFLNLAERLKVTRPVMLMESALVQIPTVVGWLRPVILLPASALTGLSPEQLEALLAHELAHIRRYDYLVNMFQTLIEILGFYHPAVWWISYTIRVERENCCDDLAVSVCGDKVGYARALTSMEEARFSQGELAVAASGGNLSRRICRLIGTGSDKNVRFGYLPVVISIMLIIALMIPTTLALTAKRGDKASSSVDTEESDSIKAVDAYTVATGQMNDSERYPLADSDEIAARAQILVKCKIFEVPVDLKFLESERKKVTVGQVVLIGSENAETLELLSEQNQDVKVIAAPQLMVLDRKEAVIKSSSGIPYITGYLPSDEDGKNPKPITKMASEDMEVRVKVRITDSGAIRTEIRLIQSKPSLTTKKDSQGREIQTPVIESNECTTDAVARSGESIIIGGLSSYAGPSRSLILMITPSIVLPEKGIERKVETDQRLLEQDETMFQYKALEEQTVELQQMLHEIQMKQAELETRKDELSELSKINSALALSKEPKSYEEPRYHTIREGDSLTVPGMELDDERIEAEKAVIQAQIDALEAKLIELRKNYEAEIFNRQSDWWAKMRAFTADVVAAKKSIFDANSVLERDLSALNKIEMEIKNFRMENGANIATDIVLHNKLKAMEANRDALQEQIKRDRAVLDRCEKEFKDAQYRREAYMQYRPMAGTDPNEAQRVINLAKRALELQLYQLKGLSAEHTSPKKPKSGEEPGYHTVREGETLSSISKKYYGSENKWQEILNCNREIITADGIRVGQKLVIPSLQASAKEPETEHERLAAMAAKCAERGDFAKAIEHLEKAIDLARVEKDYGIGIAIEKVDGLIRISQVLPDAPASGSSFRQGDIIKAIDGVSTEGMSLNEVVTRIRGPKGTKVTLTVKCHSQDITMEKTFTRQLPMKGSPALQEYYWRLDAYEAGKTWPQYREMMKNYKPLPEEAVRIYELKYANTEELAKLLNRILERRWKGIKDKTTEGVKIVPDPGHKKLIILANPAEIQLIEALIAELDVLTKRDTAVLKAAPYKEYKQDPATDRTITQVIKLKYADCESVEQILRQILSDEHLKIATDERTNMLIVAGNETAIQQIVSLVAELDVPSRKDSTDTKISPSSKLTPDTSAENAFYEIIQLKYSDCERMSEKVVKILSADQQFQLVPFKDTNRLLILGSKSAIQQVKALVAKLDVTGPNMDPEALDTNEQEKVDSDLTPSPSVE